MTDQTSTQDEQTRTRDAALAAPVVGRTGWTDLDVRAVDTARLLAADAVQKVGNGHPGTAMSLAPVAYLLFQNVMRHDPSDSHWLGRDRFVLSCGHSSLTQYVQLYLSGYGLELEDLKALRTWGSQTPGHPEVHHTNGVEITTGPLGSGLASAVGMAFAQRRQRGLFDPDAAPGQSPFDHHVYVLASDGDIMEGVSSEASSLAGHQQLGNLTLIYDANQISIEDDTDISFSEDVAKRYEAYGWHVADGRLARTAADGGAYTEDVDALLDAIERGKQVTDKPTFITLQHHHRLAGADQAEHRQVPRLGPRRRRGRGHQEAARLRPRADLRGRRRRAGPRPRGRRPAASRRTPSGRSATTPGARPTPSAPRCWTGVASRQLPEGLDEALPVFPADAKGVATRAASGKVLTALGRHACPSCGAARPTWPSPTTPPWTASRVVHPDRTGRPASGRAAPTAARCTSASASTRWASILNGIALRASPAPTAARSWSSPTTCARRSGWPRIQQLPVTYVWTHDSIGLGEDGPTHQPVEHLAALRAIPGLDVVRPGDANETAVAWRTILGAHATGRPAWP